MKPDDEDARARVFQNTLMRGLSGLGIGLVLGRIVFRRTLPTVLFTTGFGLGMSCAEAGPMLTGTASVPIYRQCPVVHKRMDVERAPDGHLNNDDDFGKVVLVDHLDDNLNKNQ